MTRLFRPASLTHQPYILIVTLVLLVAGPVPRSRAQAADSAAQGQTVSLARYGVSVQVAAGWSYRHFANLDQLLNVPSNKMATIASVDTDSIGKMYMANLQLASHSEAVDRLTIVAAERPTPSTFLTIAGWPALQRQTLIPRPELGEQEDEAESGNGTGRMLVLVTTAVAVGNSVFRLDGTVPAESPTANVIAAQMKAMGLGLAFQQPGNAAQAAEDVQKLQSNPSPRLPNAQPPETGAAPSKAQATKTSSLTTVKNISPATVPAAQTVGLSFNTTLGGSSSEPEIAVSTNGQNIVIASQFGGISSQNGGQTFGATFSFPNTQCGDSSLAYGRSGNFYEGSIGTTTTGCDSQVMDWSTNNGQTFLFRSNPVVCGVSTSCGFGSPGVPDQEHIAADRFNAGPAPLAGDQVYVVWRDSGYGIVCSTDSGNTWSTAQFPQSSADFPRVAVGEDGTVHVIYTLGDNIEVDSFSSCANGLKQLTSGAVVATATHEVVCPVPGLDRCGGLNGFFRNDLRGPTVTVDDTNPSHVYSVYATNTATTSTYPAGSGVNENVVVSDSNDNGKTWSTPIPVNEAINGRRYLPWICSVGGTAFASWFDRRNATPVTNDASDLFAGSAAPVGGVLTAQFPDFQINAPNTSDPQCGVPAGGFWPNNPGAGVFGPDKSTYATSCYVQPQLAGTCSSDNTTRCDYNTPPAGCGTCQTGDGGPKYGDYNGNACAAGRLYNVWGSATAQPFSSPPTNINVFFSQKVVCCVPQIQVPPQISLTACAGTTASTTVNLCNTGKADLQINNISSSNFDISVSTPTSGFPLIVSPDSCFPEQVTLSPGATTGPIFGTLTVASNDTVNPSATIQVTGSSPPPQIATTIANSGKFGNVCSGHVGDLNLEVLNEGQCNLNISAIFSTNPQFALPAGPLVLSPDANVDLPIAFQPVQYGSPGYVTCSNTVPETSNITLVSNDPVNPILLVPVQGIEGCPTLVLGPLNLTGANDYPPTVSDPTGTLGCHTDKQITVSNTGICPLIVANVATANGLDGKGLPLPPAPLEYTIVNTSLPFMLKPGAKPTPITVRFKPEILTDQNPTAPDQQTGTLNITSNDPLVGDNTATLCGEPVYHSGARILLVDTLDNPISSVTELLLTTTNITPPFNETLKPAPLQPPANVCGNTINYHLDNETLNPTGSNPNAYYRALVKDNPHYYPPVDFRLAQCQFRQIVIVRKY